MKQTSLVLAFVFALGSGGTALAQYERSDTTPTKWWWYVNRTVSQITGYINTNKARIIDIERNAGSSTYNVVMVSNSGTYASGWWWYVGQTPAQVTSRINQHNARILALDPYYSSGKLTFNVVLVPNTGTNKKSWWWYYNATPTVIATALKNNSARLIDIDHYRVNATTERYSVVMIANKGSDARTWWWYYGQTAKTLGDQLTKNKARLVDLERYVDNAKRVRYAGIMVSNTGSNGAGWYWSLGRTLSQLASTISATKSRLVDLEAYIVNGAPRFDGVMIVPQAPTPDSGVIVDAGAPPDSNIPPDVGAGDLGGDIPSTGDFALVDSATVDGGAVTDITTGIDGAPSLDSANSDAVASNDASSSSDGSSSGDAASGRDGGTTSGDGGGTSDDGGCCAIASDRPPFTALLVLLVLGVLLARRRRRS